MNCKCLAGKGEEFMDFMQNSILKVNFEQHLLNHNNYNNIK